MQFATHRTAVAGAHEIEGFASMQIPQVDLLQVHVLGTLAERAGKFDARHVRIVRVCRHGEDFGDVHLVIGLLFEIIFAGQMAVHLEERGMREAVAIRDFPDFFTAFAVGAA